MTRRRVVVTGLGIVCPIGNTVAEAWQNALAGKSGITRITQFDPARLACQIAGEVKGFDVAPYLSAKEARRMDTFIHYGMAAGLQAWRDCGLQVTPENAERVGINFGSGIGGLPLIEEMHNELNKNGPRRISPFFIPGTIINMIAGMLSIELGAKGPNLAIVTACTTSTHCIGEAGKSIRYGEADVMIAGGAEAMVTELAIGGFASARALSTRNDDPAAASRPWDKERDGFVLGEGAGAVVLEEYEHAKARGAKIYCELDRLRRLGRRAPHDRAARRRRRRVPRHAQRAERRLARAGADRLHQCPRHLHAARRHRRDRGGEAPARRPCRQGGGQLDQVDDRAPARRGRAASRRYSPSSRCATRFRRRPSTCATRTRSATSTTCRTRRARCRSATRCPTRSASAAPTAPWSSRAAEPRLSPGRSLQLSPSAALAALIVAAHLAAAGAAAAALPGWPGGLLAAALAALGAGRGLGPRAAALAPLDALHPDRGRDGLGRACRRRKLAGRGARGHVSRFVVTLRLAASAAAPAGHRRHARRRTRSARLRVWALWGKVPAWRGNNWQPEERPPVGVELFQSACVCGT